MQRAILLLSFALAAAGCDRAEGTARDTGKAAASAKTNTATPADDTKKNERDRDTATLTPGDQGESEADRTITQRIRQDVVKHDALSITAKNVKIITKDGVVTLRGPVKSDKEKTEIATLARGVAGVKRIDNQLEIAAD